MLHIVSKNDIYPAIEELIKILEAQSQSGLSAILRHRMHVVAWTTGDETLEEISKVLTEARTHENFKDEVLAQINRIIEVIG